MATNKAKESSGLGKERKITAPSSLTIPNTSTKRTPKSSPRGHSTDHKLSFSSSFSSSSAAHLSSLAEKHVPNYLKSTASSRHEHSSFKSTKKSAVPAPIPEGKAGLNRRRSFDKPPSTAPRLDKPFRSPGPRNRVSNFPIRSSSFGAKSTNAVISSAKVGLLERSGSRNTKGGGGKLQIQPVQSLRSSSNVKKSLKRESSNAASTEMVHKTKNSVEHVDPSPSFVLGMNDEELKKIECELDPYLPDPMPEFSKELRTDHVEKKAETPQAAAAKSLEQNEGETEKGARKEENPERIGVEEEVVADAVEEEKTETDPDHDIDPDQEGGEGGIVLDKEGGAGGAKPRQGGAGRASAVYNDVIEETASKLLEKRKNKVKALAGAFQTVIDYESSSK